MRIASSMFVMFTAAFVLGAGVAGAQEAAGGVRNSLAIQVGYGWAQGEWTGHPYAPVSFFGQDLVFGADLAFRLSDKLVLAATGFYSGLNTGEWDAYARSMGDEVTSSASMSVVALVIRPYLKSTAPDLVSVDIGPAMLFAGGSETFGGRTYEYDFMGSPRFGVLAAIEYDRCLGANYAVYGRVAGVFIPSGLQYADGWSPSVVTVPVTVGARLLF